MTFDLTQGNVSFVAEMRNSGLSWVRIGREFGVSGPTIKRAYIRGSREGDYPEPMSCSTCGSKRGVWMEDTWTCLGCGDEWPATADEREAFTRSSGRSL